MFRRVVLASGEGGDPRYRKNHEVVEGLLDRAKVPGWTKASSVDVGKGGNSKVAVRAAIELNADLIHIACQEDAHLVPRKTDVPVVVSIHNLFDHRPRSMEAGETAVSLGERVPSSTRAKQLASARKGMERADLLACANDMALNDARLLFPGTKSSLVRDSVDTSFWNPKKSARDRKLLGDMHVDGKCLVVSVGGNDSRWRTGFVDEVFSSLPSEISKEMNVIRIGLESLDMEQVAAAYQNAEVMLYPGVSVGFQCPPLEAMAAGCPVLASKLPTHDEILPGRCLLPPDVLDDWVSAIVDVHSEWRRSGGVSRNEDDGLLLLAESLGRNSHGEALSNAYEIACE